MKRQQQLKWILLLFFAILTIQSCQKDDVLIDPDPVTDTTGTDNSDGDTIDNGNDNTDGNDDEDPGDGSGTDEGESEITLYKVEGSNIVKQTDYKVSGTDLEFQK
ncbi:MAG: hypothetical protein AB3N18_12455, partial [Allomuricauda sp.]